MKTQYTYKEIEITIHQEEDICSHCNNENCNICKLEPAEHYGTIFGYVTSDFEQIENYLSSHQQSEQLIKKIKKGYNKTTIALIQSLFVEEEIRRLGIGHSLLFSFLDKAIENGASHVLLESDTGEGNLFDLTHWYESCGFKKVDKLEQNYPIMICKI